MLIREALEWAEKLLSSVSVSPRLDAEVLLSLALKKDQAHLLANPETRLAGRDEALFVRLIRKRAKNWPVSYLTGHKEFFGLKFQVSPAALIPRPESETLVERALTILQSPGGHFHSVLDIGTGSGCLIVSLAKTFKGKKIKFYGTDVSPRALRIAKLNAQAHGIISKIKFLQGELLHPILKSKILEKGGVIILANLPYLTSVQIRGNPQLWREPKLALFGGQDGLRHYRELFRQIKTSRHSQIILLIEHDPRQRIKLKKLPQRYWPKNPIVCHKDLAGLSRVTEIKIPVNI